jgi:hypothetical protein
MWFWSLVIIGILILAVVLFAQGPNDTGRTMSPDAGAGGAAAMGAQATVEEVTSNPQQYLGSVVTVSGNLEEVISPTAIRLSSGGILGIGEDDILVLGQEAFPPGVSERRQELSLQVTGPVQIFNRIEFEQDWGVDLDDELFTVYEGRPYIVAQSLAMTTGEPGDDQLGAASGAGEEGMGETEGVESAPEGGTAAGAGEQSTGQETDLSRITENTESYLGDTVIVSGFVAKLVDSNAFSISPTPGAEGQGLLVVAQPQDIPAIQAGDEVKIQGLVRSFDLKQYETELGLDMDDILLGEWDQDPSLMAISIEKVESPTASGPQERGAGGAPQDTALLEQPQDTLLLDTLE